MLGRVLSEIDGDKAILYLFAALCGVILALIIEHLRIYLDSCSENKDVSDDDVDECADDADDIPF